MIFCSFSTLFSHISKPTQHKFNFLPKQTPRIAPLRHKLPQNFAHVVQKFHLLQNAQHLASNPTCANTGKAKPIHSNCCCNAKSNNKMASIFAHAPPKPHPRMRQNNVFVCIFCFFSTKKQTNIHNVPFEMQLKPTANCRMFFPKNTHTFFAQSKSSINRRDRRPRRSVIIALVAMLANSTKSLAGLLSTKPPC